MSQNFESKIEKMYQEKDAKFIKNISHWKPSLLTIKSLLFDWDGVFNDGIKTDNYPSGFSESDSMGINLLRYSFWRNNQKIPLCGIVTGELNPSAITLAKREHLDFIVLGLKDKKDVHKLLSSFYFDFAPNQSMFFFDDVLDLGLAKICGMRMMIHRKAGLALENYVENNNLADYISFSEGGNHAIRECCELIMQINGNWLDVVKNRAEHSQEYKEYFTERQSITTRFFKIVDNLLVEQKI